MSDAQRHQLTALLQTVDQHLRAAIEARGAQPEQVFERGILRAAEAREMGLCAETCYEDELPRLLTGEAEGKLGAAERYLRWAERRYFVPLRRQPYVAVVPIHGAIVPGRGRPGLSRRPVAAQTPTLQTIRAVGRDRRAVAGVIHVNSPGGSALSSDLIHREVRALAAIKPVVACMGEVAASGGYYVSAPVPIVAVALTVTGSIGVILTKVLLRGS